MSRIVTIVVEPETVDERAAGYARTLSPELRRTALTPVGWLVVLTCTAGACWLILRACGVL